MTDPRFGMAHITITGDGLRTVKLSEGGNWFDDSASLNLKQAVGLRDWLSDWLDRQRVDPIAQLAGKLEALAAEIRALFR